MNWWHTLTKYAYARLIAMVGNGELINGQSLVRGSDLLSIRSRQPSYIDVIIDTCKIRKTEINVKNEC